MNTTDPLYALEPETASDAATDAALENLVRSIEEYLDADQIALVYRAYRFGTEAHKQQKRLTGEPYICHPLAVATILSQLRLDSQSIIAALLHDVLEDTPVTKDQLVKEFGHEVAELVDGVTKLTQIKFETRQEAEAENLRKMLLAMVRDIRVIVIKLADRLHNMRTAQALPPYKRRWIARETLDIYAPIANRLGMNNMRTELQELGFAASHPHRYHVLEQTLLQARGNRKEVVQKIEDSICQRLEQENMVAHVQGREKHLYSLYQKMRAKHLSFADVNDVYAFRITVDTVDACYRALGIIHGLYKPVPGKFKDYIAIPKNNGYQSLHTVLFGPIGMPIEVQIRTHDMEKVAESGVAAHWLYKLGDQGDTSNPHVREWLRSLLEIQKNAGNSMEFLENVKIDLFPDEVYVFTPQGKILQLHRGATAVDFAYAVHTDVGNSCIAAKIDRRLAPLSTVLENGQTVEVVTAPGARPNPAWLNFVVTGKARTNIRHFLKRLKDEEAISFGRRLLNRALADFSMSLETLPEQDLKLCLEQLHLDDLDRLLAEIGLGKRLGLLVAKRIVANAEGDTQPVRRRNSIRRAWNRYAPSWLGGDRDVVHPLGIQGTEGMVVHFAKCCRPIPGDPILGIVTAGRGIVIHGESCKNIKPCRGQSGKCIEVQWEPETGRTFPVDIRVDVVNHRGVLATVAAAIADLEANTENVGIEERDGRYSVIKFTIAVRNRKHLAEIMRRVKAIDDVVRIYRAKS